ncbi:MAG TPA: 2-polyprenylphenol 6-hydroxylase [Caulobacteraceae bacterium]|nr:2-polyprenylphenol 6-hydroxylase [Caulobacteraceae bacterium]
MSNPVISGARLLAAGWVLVRHDALAPKELDPFLPPLARFIARFLRLFSSRKGRMGRPGERVARALQSLGPVAIKLGQVLATRADVFGIVFANDLGHLKDRLPPFPAEVAKAEIELALGKPLGELFTDFEDVPTGAASLAQAHAAVFKDGRKVAVKVLRPRIERRVAEDIDVMRLGAGLVYALVPLARRLEPRAFVETVARSLLLELDMRMEAGAADELGAIMREDHYMRAPAVVWQGVGRRCLTLEWAQGVPLSDPAAMEQPGLNRRALADNVVRAFLSQALDHGAFHADLHEGNLFCAAPDRLTAVDFGIIGRLSPDERRYLAEILWGFINRDYRQVARAHFEAGYVPASHSMETFAQALRSVGEPVIGRPASEVSMGRLLGQLFEITALFDMRLRPELVLLQKTMVTVEGVARRIDPDNDLWAAAQPVVERWMQRELSPLNKLRDNLEELMRAGRALVKLAEHPQAQVTVDRRGDSLVKWAVALAVAALLVAGGALGAQFL